MGILNKMFKPKLEMQAYAETIASNNDIVVAYWKVLDSVIAVAMTARGNSKLDFKALSPEQAFSGREFWDAMFRYSAACFGSAQRSCSVEENKSSEMALAWEKALRTSYEPLMRKHSVPDRSSREKEIEDLPFSYLTRYPRIYHFLQFFHQTGNSEQVLNHLVSVDTGKHNLMDKHFVASTRGFIDTLDNAIITDWEKYYPLAIE